MVLLKFNWQQTAIIVVGVMGLAGFIVRSLLTGEDIPINFQIIFGAIFGIALGGAGISTLFSRDQKTEDKKKEDEDAK